MRMSRTEHPGSTGGWTASQVEYDLLGRVKRQSVPTEITVPNANNPETWTPSGDDNRGTGVWLWTHQKYDWKGRVVRKINTDGTDSSTLNDSDVLISYEGCGCAGGQVTTIESERVPIPNTTNYARRKQRIYEDILGRTVKTEAFEWDGSTVYSTVTNTYNGRDQVTQALEYAGTTYSSSNQETTASFDGFGRLKQTHKPEQRDGSTLKYTTYTYNPDDSIQSLTDARGATTQFTYNNRGLVETKSYTVPSESNIDDPADVSFSYDNVGNRTQMTDGLGQVDYEYDPLSRLTAETRDFTDDLPNAPITGSKFKLEYTYTLSGGLRSYTDAYGKTINYANDRTGRITAVTGASIVGNYDYADNPHYRAWGALTHLDYGNGTEMNVGGFNNKLQATTFEVKKGTTSMINKSYDFYADGSLKNETDNNNAKFDRLYKYDHRSRMTDARSGAEARGSTDAAVNIPFGNAFQYDAFDHQTQLVTKHFTRSDTINPSYQNNREQYGTYDLDGRMEVDGWMQQKMYKYNAAGQLGYSIYQSCGEPCTTDEETLKYDGDGLLVKVQTSHTVNEDDPIIESTYKIRSSAMGGEEIVTAESFGNRIVTYVRAAGTTIATHSSVISWMHKDLNMNSMRSTREDGTLIEQEGGSNLGKHELDPAGNSVGFSDPYTVSYPDPFPYFFQPFESFGSLVNGQFQSYSVDGIQVPRSYFSDQIDLAFGGIFGLVEHQAKMSAHTLIELQVGGRRYKPNLAGAERAIGEALETGSAITRIWSASTSWALNLSLTPQSGGLQTRVAAPLDSVENTAASNTMTELARRLNDLTKVGKDCKKNVLDKLAKIQGFSLVNFLVFLEQKSEFYNGNTSTVLQQTYHPNEGYPGTFTVADRFKNAPRVKAETSSNPSQPFTVFFRPNYIDTSEQLSPTTGERLVGIDSDNLALFFHEALHGYGVATGSLSSFTDSALMTILGETDSKGRVTPLSNADGSVVISNYIKRHCF